MASLGYDLSVLGDRPAGLERARRARSIAAQTGNDDIVSRTAIPLSDVIAPRRSTGRAVDVGLAGAQESRRAGLDMREGFSALNAGEAAFELGRRDLVARLSRDVLARNLTRVTLAFAHYVAGILACVRAGRARRRRRSPRRAARRRRAGPDSA